MTLTYRGAGAWGPGKGGPLTSAEIDGNFKWVADQLQDIRNNPGEPVQFQSFELIGNALYVHLSNGDVHGPYSLPIPATPEYLPPAVISVTGSTLAPALGDANGYYRCSNATACAVTIPNNTAVAFPVRTELTFRQSAAGKITITGASGVLINPPEVGATLTTTGAGCTITLKKTGANDWDYIGPSEVAP